MSPTIGAKIFAGMVAVSLTFIFAALFILNRFLGGIVEDEVSYALFRGERAYERFVVLHDNLFAVQARSVAQTPHLKAVMNIACCWPMWAILPFSVTTWVFFPVSKGG